MRKVILIMLVLCVPVHAQQPARKFDVADGALVAAMLGDELTSPGASWGCRFCHEGGALRNTGLRIGVKAGLFVGFKALEYHYTKTAERRAIWIAKLIVAGGFTAIMLHNKGLK